MTERLLVTGGSGFIGSHLIDQITLRKFEVINLDVKQPLIQGHDKYWLACDIKDMHSLANVFKGFMPTHIIHLAAKANLNGKTIADFPDNTTGTANLVECVNKTDSVKLLINTSTQYVVMPGVLPIDGSHFEPYTAYGESKAAAERLVRDNCIRPWTIIRPTNIWGPGHPFFPSELWRYLELRYYIHPGFRPIRKYYGYVGNAVKQILHIALAKNPADVVEKVWYITDGAIDNAVWMNGFSLGLSGKTIRRVPLSIWWMAALAGNIFRSMGLKSPINLERFFRLTVNENLPEDMFVKLTPQESISLQEGIATCIKWYRETYIMNKS